MKESGDPIQQKLALTRRWWRTMRLLAGLAWVVCVVVLLGLICYHADRALVLSALAREKWRLGIGVAALITLVLALVRPLLRPLPDKTLAAYVERRYPALRERLLTTVDLAPALAASGAGSNTSSSSFSAPMIAALAEETRRAAADLDFRRAVSARPLRVAFLSAAFTLALLALHIVFAPQAFAVWLRRMISPRADIAPYAHTRVWVVPAADVLPRGEGLSLAVLTQGAPADRCRLSYRLEGDPPNAWNTVELTRPTPAAARPSASEQTATRLEADGKAQKFQFRFPAVTRNIELYATANDGRSNPRQVTVEDRPTLLKMRLTLRYPAYTHRGVESLGDSTGNIAAPVGTEVAVEAIANKPLRSVLCEREGAADRWRVQGEKAFGHFSIWKNGSYSLKLTDRHGFDNLTAPRYDIRAQKDQTPVVQITRPATDIDLVPNGILSFSSHATDDYGIAGMRLVYDHLRGEGGKSHIRRGSAPLPGPFGAKQVAKDDRLDITNVQAQPGDTIRYEVDATDNDTIRGPHTGRSLAYRIHVVSLPEMQARLKEQLDEEARALAQLRQRQIEAQKLLAQARQKPNNAALSRAQEAQRSTAEETRALTRRVGELTEQLESNRLATPSEKQRRDAAEHVLQNLAQQKMPAAAGAIQRSSRTSSLAQADRQESAIRRDIERAQELLSRTPPPDQLAAEAARLAQEQQRLADSARSLAEDIHANRPQEGRAALTPEQKIGMQTERQQQAQANADTRRLQQQLEQAARAAQERGDTHMAQLLRRAAQSMRQGNVTGNQRQAQNSLQHNQPAAAAPAQERAAAALQKAAQAAQQASAQSQNDTPQAAADRLEQAAEKLREMAMRQRQVANQVSEGANTAQSRQLAQQERALQQQSNQVMQSLNSSANAQRSLQGAQQNLGRSAQQLSQNNAQAASPSAEKAVDQLMQAAQQAMQAARQMRQQQVANELRERVERLAQVQHGLQRTTQRLQRAGEHGALNENEQRELYKVSAQQERLENEARDLADRFPSLAFKQALRGASRQMHPATMNLNHDPPLPNAETQTAQGKAARTLDVIAQALKQQAQGGGQQSGGGQQQGGSNMSPQEAQAAAALGELMLAQGLQRQLRQDTGALDRERARNQDQNLTRAQQREANQLTEGQRDAQYITRRAGESLSDIPGLQEPIQQATQHMGQAAQKLFSQQTGQPTQSHQDTALRHLDRAVNIAQQALQQQEQQQQARQQAGQGAPQPGQQRGNSPDRRGALRIEEVRRGKTFSPDPRLGRGFGALTPRAQRTMREGQQERVPAEFQPLVDRYYKSLAEKKR
ncbi:MAG TPA: hypothetical protein VFB38_00400 [Chthonomonadaceae bacterium]|nr:hypothetical protein [Chthonomonadaceae bacterium]